MNERISKNENKGSNGNNSVVLSIWPICSRHRRGWDWLLVSDCGLESKRHHRRREERRRTVDGKPWVRSLERRGRLRVDLRGLILPSVGTPGPLTCGCQSVVCGDAVAATTDSVLLSVDGNAEIHAKLQVPSPCLGTIVLIRAAAFNGTPLPTPGPWIAATGLVKDSVFQSR